ncbi:MAG TPA: BamA/TamA family outer membrane protein [Sphingomicrobium sp.]|nr:BamA/TamA family outer membrane protein [Sphingomicrobium sp.]
MAAQQVPPGDLDPSAPLDALPGLGVDWPDLDTPDPVPLADAVPSPQPVQAENDAGALRYTVTLAGIQALPDAAELSEAFDRQSELRQEDDEPANAARVERRIRADAELLTELLRSRGYYDASVAPKVEQAGGALRITLTAAPGDPYRFAAVELPGLEAAGAEAAALRRSFAVAPGDPVVAADVLAAGIALRVALGEQGFALAEVGEQDIEIDHRTRTARLVLAVQPGPLSRFGAIRVSGQPPFSAAHVGRIARFEPGEPFRRSRVDDLRRALIATGLVSAAEVRIVPGERPNTVDLAVRLDPAPVRTIAGELGYGTGEGVRAEASWQHRNLLHPEGALTVRGVAGTQEQLAGVQFRRNNFGQRDQVLNLHTSVSHIDRNAYEARTVLVGGNIERQSNFIWHKKWTWSLGADFIGTDERGVYDLAATAKSSRKFLIAAVPASLGYDASDNLLDPTRGFRLLGRVSPEYSAYGGSFGYGRLQLDGSVYRPLSDSVVGAARVRLAGIAGASTTDIAPSRRLYAGGGGSVRGYGYQKLGPRDIEGDPIGGRGLAEFALESRIRLKLLGGNFGLVPFLDGGSLSVRSWPSFSDWQFGAGLGVRYYSSFGPIRVDIGTPLNPRRGDSPVAVTVSLGQAF